MAIRINDLNFSKKQMTILRQYFAYLEANKITRTKCYLMCVNDYLYRLKCFVCIIIRREVLCYCCCYSNIYLPFVTKFVCFRDFQITWYRLCSDVIVVKKRRVFIGDRQYNTLKFMKDFVFKYVEIIFILLQFNLSNDFIW